MKRLPWLFIAFSLILGGCSSHQSTRLHVVATTSMLSTVIQDIGGDNVKCDVLVPPGSCPGHYDIRPGDMVSILNGGALYWQGYESFIPPLLNSLEKKNLKVCKVDVAGDWLIPDIYIRAGSVVERTLSGIDPTHAKQYARNFKVLELQAQRTGEAVLNEVHSVGAKNIRVLCSNQQTPLLKWMGFEVVGDYGRAEYFTPENLHRLLTLAQRRHVHLVVDNLQSGPDAGVQLAHDVGAAHVTLSNFPGGFEDTPTWATCLQRNAQILIDAIRKQRVSNQK
jgi:zinc transport system substrate-binding protein